MQDKVIAAAEKWLGYLEKKSSAQLDSLTANAGDKNYTIFAEQYKKLWDEDYQAQPWCAVFVSLMLLEGCGKELVPHFAYCPYGVDGFKRRGQWLSGSPQRGDVIFFKDSRGVACHVGLVSSTGGGRVVTIEGNTSSEPGVIANGGCVRKKSYDIGYDRILGYGRPAYEDEKQDCTAETVRQLVQAAMTDCFCDFYDRINPKYTGIQQVPAYWQAEVKEMMQCGAIKGDGVHAINIRHDALQAAVIAYRAAAAMQ